jgi:hypothetical protein
MSSVSAFRELLRGSYAAFKHVGDATMVMGDLVRLDQEVPAVMSGLLNGGLQVTAGCSSIALVSLAGAEIDLVIRFDRRLRRSPCLTRSP